MEVVEIRERNDVTEEKDKSRKETLEEKREKKKVTRMWTTE